MPGCARQETATEVSAAVTETPVTSGANTTDWAVAGGEQASPPRSAKTL